MSRPALVALAAVALLACSSPAPPPAPDGFEQMSASPRDTLRRASAIAVPAVSDVIVRVVSEEIPPDRLARLREQEADSLIRRAFLTELQRRAQLDKSSRYAIRLTIDEYRIRSTFSSAMVGSMAGRDAVGGHAELLAADGSIVRAMQARAVSIKGGVFYPSASGRLNNLAWALARDVVPKLMPLSEARGG
jgi:hypothetical protein